MGSNTVKLVIAEMHVALGLAAVGTLAATGHMDSTVAAGFIGALMGIGVTPPLVAYSPLADAQASALALGSADRTTAPAGVQAAPPGAPGAPAEALTPGGITGTSAMPSQG